jgi:radical SAM superfamily enzyme YgiQ (UPF0313 family)
LKVLLISPNREQLPDPVFPLGLAYIASALHKEGHDIRIVDLCFEEAIDNALKSTIQTFLPEVIGISIRNIDDVSYPRSVYYLSLYKEVIEICRRYTAAPIVAGGAGFTIMPEAFINTLNIDYGIVGEGESAVVQLMRYIDKGGKIPHGVVTPRKLKVSPCREKTWIRPLRNFFNVKEYYERGGMLNIQLKRGCPFKCIYCSYPKIEGNKLRIRSIEHVVDEIGEMVEQGVRHFFIVDSIFNHPRQYALRFCSEVLRRGLKISWNCYANPGLMDAELIEAMVRAGCSGVEFGTDSLVDEILRSLKKGFTYKQVKEVSQLCKDLGLKFCHFIFLGAPEERPDDAKRNLERLSYLDADSSVVMVGIRIFPGTELSERARVELGLKEIGLEPVYYISPHFNGLIEKFVEDASAEHKKWIFPGFGINFNERLQRFLRKGGIKGSLWEALSKR